MSITISIEARDTLDAEEKILEMADDIRERRALVAAGCTCDLRLPRWVDGRLTAERCTGPFAICAARNIKLESIAAASKAAADAQRAIQAAA
jgi:hypothetical protein